MGASLQKKNLISLTQTVQVQRSWKTRIGLKRRVLWLCTKVTKGIRSVEHTGLPSCCLSEALVSVTPALFTVRVNGVNGCIYNGTDPGVTFRANCHDLRLSAAARFVLRSVGVFTIVGYGFSCQESAAYAEKLPSRWITMPASKST